jgi:hypothetical protein
MPHSRSVARTNRPREIQTYGTDAIVGTDLKGLERFGCDGPRQVHEDAGGGMVVIHEFEDIMNPSRSQNVQVGLRNGQVNNSANQFDVVCETSNKETLI